MVIEVTKRIRKEKIVVDRPNELYSFLKIVGVILVILFIVFMIASDNSTVQSENQYKNVNYIVSEDITNEILANGIFDRNEKNYYVLIYDFDSDERFLFNRLVAKDELPIYRVNTTNPINSEIVGETNLTGEDIKVSDYALIKVSNKKNVYSDTNIVSITDYLLGIETEN